MKYSGSKGVRYCGGKGKCQEIIKIIQDLLPSRGGFFWDCMGGSGKITQGVRCETRILSDIDPHIVNLLMAIQVGWIPPDSVSERAYRYWMRQYKEEPLCADPMVGFCGYGLSFGARFFQGYARSKSGTVNFAKTAKAALLRQKPFMRGVTFLTGDYKKLYKDFDYAPDVIYCDIPYKGTKHVGQGKPFDHDQFYKWVEFAAKQSIILISEYECSIEDAKVVWSQSTAAGIRFGTGGDGGAKGIGKRKLEKLFLVARGDSPRIGLGLYNG